MQSLGLFFQSRAYPIRFLLIHPALLKLIKSGSKPFLASMGFKVCSVTASISGLKLVISQVRSLSFKTDLPYDKITVIVTVKMPVSWRWTPSLLFRSANVMIPQGVILLAYYFKAFC